MGEEAQDGYGVKEKTGGGSRDDIIGLDCTGMNCGGAPDLCFLVCLVSERLDVQLMVDLELQDVLDVRASCSNILD